MIVDKSVSKDYARPVEVISDKCRVMRVQCGGRKYMRKELLWPHLDEYVDKTIKTIKRQNHIPDIVHGHYPDAGYVASMLAAFFGTPMVYTGHSLGRSKLDRLLSDGMSRQSIDKFCPYYRDALPEPGKSERQMYAKASVMKELDRFWRPLAATRPVLVWK